MPAAAKGVEDLRSHRLTKASLFFEDTLRGHAIYFYQERVGTTAWVLRNATPTVTRTPPRGLRQYKRSGITVRSIIWKN